MNKKIYKNTRIIISGQKLDSSPVMIKNKCMWKNEYKTIAIVYISDL